MTPLIRILKFIMIGTSLLLYLPFCMASNSSVNWSKANKTVLSKQQLFENLSRIQIASQLNWVPSSDPCNFCNGFYQEPLSLAAYPHPQPIRSLPTQITAAGPVLFLANGMSVLQDNVVITQPGRIAKADRVMIERDGKTRKVTLIRLMGNAHLYEHGKHIVADTIILDEVADTVTFYNTLYQVSESELPELKENKKLKYDAWGKALHIFRDKARVLQLWHATYTTCAPLNPVWELFASHLILNKETGVGQSYNTLVKVKNIPIFYSPYLSFPVDNRRKSGFLSMTPAYSKVNGFRLTVPYYWNMAPNYDMTITPEYWSKRGTVSIEDLFRYFTAHNQGYIDATIVPADQEFKSFRDYTLRNTIPNLNVLPYLQDLKDASSNRGYFSAWDESQFNAQLSGKLNLNYVTDPYYFRDFNSSPVAGTINQLLNQAELEFNGTHWQGIGLIQSYQTLHVITQMNQAFNQYTRLPEFNLNGEYPELPLGLDLRMNGQAVNFLYQSDFFPQTFRMPIGQRLHGLASLSEPIYRGAGFIIPQISLDTTQYFAHMQACGPNLPRPTFDGNRTLPIFNIDSGLYFDRSFNWRDGLYTQTFEPRFFYLGVPYQNQDKYPFFDTMLLPFSFEQLFALNRFVGFDRLENANQLSIGLTSRMLDAMDGFQKLRADLGMAYYFQQMRVPMPNVLNPLYPIYPDSGNFSPLVGQLAYNPWTNWSLSSSLAWDVNRSQMNNFDVDFAYTSDDQHIVSVKYQYVPNITHPAFEATNLITAGVSWPIFHQWNALGYWFYNTQKVHVQSYYGGLEYSTCCYAVRLLVNRQFLGVLPPTVGNQQSQTQYKTTYFVKFMLKGLGDIGSGDPSLLLQSTLPGYHDPFKN
jgi:LPS-assembly protein